MVTASIRTAIRIRLHKRVFADDAFLLFACSTLTALIATVFHDEPTIYLVQAVSSGQLQQGSAALPANGSSSALIPTYRKAQFLRGSLSWLTIFAVKFSFLAFFYPLTNRLPTLFFYWRVVVAVNILASVYCITCGFFGCLKSGEETCESSC